MDNNTSDTRTLTQRAEVAEGCLSALVTELGKLSTAVLAHRMNNVEAKTRDNGARVGTLEASHANVEKCVEALAAKVDRLGRFVMRLKHEMEGRPNEQAEATNATDAARSGNLAAQANQATPHV